MKESRVGRHVRIRKSDTHVKFARKFKLMRYLIVMSGCVHCISLSSEMQLTALTLMKSCWFVSTAFLVVELANQCFRFLLTFLLYSACVSDMSELQKMWLFTKTALEQSRRRCSFGQNWTRTSLLLSSLWRESSLESTRQREWSTTYTEAGATCSKRSRGVAV